MELLTRYSGITAIIVYSLILFVILKLTKKKRVTKEETTDNNVEEKNRTYERLDLADEDATVACLVASIDARQQYHKNVQILSVRRIG